MSTPKPRSAGLVPDADFPRRPGWRPLAFTVVSLVLLVVLPVLVSRQVDRARRTLADVVTPARTHLDRVRHSLAAQAAAAHGYALTSNESFREAFRRARDDEARSVAALEPLAARLGPLAEQRLAELREARNRWTVSVRGLVEDTLGPSDYALALTESQVLFERTFAVAQLLDEAIAASESALGDRIVVLQRRSASATAILALLALGAAASVAGLVRRLGRLARALRYRAQEEQALRRIARSLSAAMSVREVANQVAESAVETAGSPGAFVELVQEKDVVIAGASGDGVPPVGTRIRYDESLTQVVSPAGEPEIVEVRGGRSMAPYLRDHCPDCSAIIVPLASEGRALGALVLLRGARQGRFEAGEAAHVRVLADLASAALRRVILLEQTERERGLLVESVQREREARAAAEAALRTRDEVLAVVSHDLRNPLNSILGNASLLLQMPVDEQQREKQLQIIKRSAERMNRLIQDLLDVARLEAGQKLVLEPRRLELAPVLTETCESFQPQVREKSQQLECRVASGLPPVHADRDRLVQALSNLIGNAVKFTPQGGRIVVEAKVVDGEMRLIVADTGPGIPPEHLDRVFDPYWQARTTARLGAGLGLPIAKGVVEAHGGRIWAESRPGGGTTLSFTLPLTEVPQPVHG